MNTRRKQQSPAAESVRDLPRLRRILAGSSETLLAIGLVLVFFSIFTGILVASFPRGTGLKSLYGELVSSKRDAVDVALAEKGRMFIARVSDKTRVVKDRADHAVAWRSSWAGMELGNNHAIQTFNRAGAVISFEDRNELQLGQNSLVVLRQETGVYDWMADRASLVVLGGEVRGRLSTIRDALPLDIVAAGATARLDSTGDQPAEFQVTAQGDDAATLKIYSGSAEVTLGGETALIQRDQALTIRAGEPLGQPLRIPQAPRLLAPPDGHVEVFGTSPPIATLRWSPVDIADQYQVIVAHDPELQQVAARETLSAPQYDFSSLDPGWYYWQVIGSNGPNGAIKSEPSAIRAFQLDQDRVPPTLRVDLPSLDIEGDRVVVRGLTEPGARILIGSASVLPEESGEFEHTLTLHPGPNLIVVEAVDSHGNATYFSEYVNARRTAPGDRQ